ncbi:hypothetical protein V8E51_000140 [Hyaloscypha variabilis]
MVFVVRTRLKQQTRFQSSEHLRYARANLKPQTPFYKTSEALFDPPSHQSYKVNNSHAQIPTMKEPDLTLRAQSLPNLPSTPPAEKVELTPLDEEAEEVAICHAMLATLRTKNAKIRDLNQQLQHQLALSASQDDALQKSKQELDIAEKSLEQVRDGAKETRTEFTKLKKGHSQKQAEICKLNETIQRLEREKLELKESAGQQSAMANNILEEQLSVVKRRRDCLETEVELLRKVKADTDIAKTRLEKEKKLLVSEMESLTKERDEVKEEKQALLSKVQGFDVAKQDLVDLVAKRERTTDEKLQDIENLESDIRRIREERDKYRDRVHRREEDNDELEGELNGLKRKLDNINAAILAPVNVEVPPAKRPRTPQSTKRDIVAACPRAMAVGSPDSHRSVLMSSPTDGRQPRVPGNEFFSTVNILHCTDAAPCNEDPMRCFPFSIITFHLNPHHLRPFPDTASPNMESTAPPPSIPQVNPEHPQHGSLSKSPTTTESTTFPDPVSQLQWIIDTQGLDFTAKQRPETIKTTIGVLHKRHEEVMREKESKILGLEFQLITSTNEKAKQEEKIVQLEKEKDKLCQENMGLKRENAAVVELRELVHRATGVIEEQDQNIHNLQVEITEAKKSLKSAREVNMSLRGRVEGQLRRNRRIAKTLLATVMELDSDVAIPGKQRPFSERQVLERTSPRPSEPSIGELYYPKSTSNNRVLCFMEDSEGDEDTLTSNSVATTFPLATTHASRDPSQRSIKTAFFAPLTRDPMLSYEEMALDNIDFDSTQFMVQKFL